MPQPAALEAAAAPRIDPAEAVDVWQENLSARTGQPATSRPGTGQRATSRPWTGQPATSQPGAGQRQPAGAGPAAEIAADAADPADPADEYLVDLWPGTSPTSHTAWKDKK